MTRCNFFHFALLPQNAGHALLHPSTASILGIKERSPLSFISLAEGSDCVVPVTVTTTSIAKGSIALTTTQQYNLHAKVGTKLSIRRFTPPLDEPISLVDIDLEVSLLPGAKKFTFDNSDDVEHEDEEHQVNPYIIDAVKVSDHFLKAYLGLIVAKNEACVFPLATFLENDPEVKKNEEEESPAPAADNSHEAQLALRVRACNTLDQETAADTLGYHCCRGVITPETAIYITQLQSTQTNSNFMCASKASGTTSALELINARLRPPLGTNKHLIDIQTNDGEHFPVHRKLLRPCIALTKPVRTPGSGVTATIDVDTLTFDRVLIFLEAHVLNKSLPSFGIHLVSPLKEAAEKLQLGSLVEWCEKRLSDSASRIRWHSYKEIEERNTAGGEVLLIMDGMVFDVTNWLPEHPGGSTIIPSQAVNIDSSRFFELYHASRESFIYLREFYTGEILPSDRDAVPRSDVEPSDDFLAQLRQWTKDFRLEDDVEKAFKSF